MLCVECITITIQKGIKSETADKWPKTNLFIHDFRSSGWWKNKINKAKFKLGN